jgi:hypothetical protein
MVGDGLQFTLEKRGYCGVCPRIGRREAGGQRVVLPTGEGLWHGFCNEMATPMVGGRKLRENYGKSTWN